MSRQWAGLVVALGVTLAAAGCEESFSPGRPRTPPPEWAGARPLTSPAAALEDVRVAYETRNLALLASALDPHMYFSDVEFSRAPACTYACELERARALFADPALRHVYFTLSPDTIPVPTFAPLDPPGALLFHLRRTDWLAVYVGRDSDRLVRGAQVTIAPTGPQSAPWRIVQWRWTAAEPDSTVGIAEPDSTGVIGTLPDSASLGPRPR